jgi:hypothetical protein
MLSLSKFKIVIALAGGISLGVFVAWPMAVAGAQDGRRPEPAVPVPWSTLLPGGAGKDYVNALCNRCHTVGLLMIQKRSRSQWRLLLENINTARESGSELCACRGGPLSDDDIESISSYMGEAFGANNPIESLPINVNRAPLKALLLLPGMDKAAAEKLMQIRRAKMFVSKGELEKILGRERYLKMEPYFDVRESNFRLDGFLPM